MEIIANQGLGNWLRYVGQAIIPSVFNKKKVEGEVDKVGGGPAAAATGRCHADRFLIFLVSVGEFWCILRE